MVDSLGDRMKAYERVSNGELMRRTPVIIRLDGCAFHTLAKGIDRPYDTVLSGAMQDTMLQLCKKIQGCVLGYTQSDEITLLIVDYFRLETQPWFSNNIQKMVSVSASIATLEFNKSICSRIDGCNIDKYEKLKSATFDSRVFNIPKGDAANCLV